MKLEAPIGTMGNLFVSFTSIIVISLNLMEKKKIQIVLQFVFDFHFESQKFLSDLFLFFRFKSNGKGSD